MSLSSILSTENPVFKGYVFYGTILVFKVMYMAVLTAWQRYKHSVFPKSEAAKNLKAKIAEDVERVRRAHRNDLENIPIFFVAAFGYMLTNPPVITALILFKVLTASRFIYTLVYAVFVVPQPARAIAFGIGNIITGYMALETVIHFL